MQFKSDDATATLASIRYRTPGWRAVIAACAILLLPLSVAGCGHDDAVTPGSESINNSNSSGLPTANSGPVQPAPPATSLPTSGDPNSSVTVHLPQPVNGQYQVIFYALAGSNSSNFVQAGPPVTGLTPDANGNLTFQVPFQLPPGEYQAQISGPNQIYESFPYQITNPAGSTTGGATGGTTGGTSGGTTGAKA